MVIGMDLKHYTHVVKLGIDDYLILVVMDKPFPEPGLFQEQFFNSLKPHTRIYERNEVVFESGLTLNVKDILKEPEGSCVDVARLVERGIFGVPRTYCYSYPKSICERTLVNLFGASIVVNMKLA